MNDVIGLTGLLLDSDLTEVQPSDAAGVQGAGEALLAIIDDILDVSMPEAGKVDPEQVRFDPRQLEPSGELVERLGTALDQASRALTSALPVST